MNESKTSYTEPTPGTTALNAAACGTSAIATAYEVWRVFAKGDEWAWLLAIIFAGMFATNAFCVTWRLKRG